MTVYREDAPPRRRPLYGQLIGCRDPQTWILVEIDRRYGRPFKIPRFVVPLQILRHFDFDPICQFSISSITLINVSPLRQVFQVTLKSNRRVVIYLRGTVAGAAVRPS